MNLSSSIHSHDNQLIIIMLKFALILMFVCIQLSLIHCYTINHLQVSEGEQRRNQQRALLFQRPLWSELEGEPNEEFLAKLFRTETFLNEVSPAATGLFDQADGHPRGLQKRGRRKILLLLSRLTRRVF